MWRPSNWWIHNFFPSFPTFLFHGELLTYSSVSFSRISFPLASFTPSGLKLQAINKFPLFPPIIFFALLNFHNFLSRLSLSPFGFRRQRLFSFVVSIRTESNNPPRVFVMCFQRGPWRNRVTNLHIISCPTQVSRSISISSALSRLWRNIRSSPSQDIFGT